jgi:hypothetical protein
VYDSDMGLDGEVLVYAYLAVTALIADRAWRQGSILQTTGSTSAS